MRPESEPRSKRCLGGCGPFWVRVLAMAAFTLAFGGGFGLVVGLTYFGSER